MPETFAELDCQSSASSRRHYRDMQDIEFTIQEGKLWMLQTRNGKRTTRPPSRSPSIWPTKA